MHVPKNNASSTVGAARTSGAGALTVASGHGSRFPSQFPFIVTVLRGPRDTETVLCILNVTGRTSDTLTISGAIEGTTDANMVTTDRVEIRHTALAMTEIHDALATLTTSVAAITSNIDGGTASTNYGGTTPIDGGTA